MLESWLFFVLLARPLPMLPCFSCRDDGVALCLACSRAACLASSILNETKKMNMTSAFARTFARKKENPNPSEDLSSPLPPPTTTTHQPSKPKKAPSQRHGWLLLAGWSGIAPRISAVLQEKHKSKASRRKAAVLCLFGRDNTIHR